MHILVTTAFFLAALLTTLIRGAGSAFAFFYLPALLLLSQARSVSLFALPDVTPPTACIYAILIGSLVRGRWPRPGRSSSNYSGSMIGDLLRNRWPQLRPSPVDGILVLIWFAYIVSAVRTDTLYAGVGIFGSMALDLVVPYFVVRCTIENKTTQRETLFMLVSVTAIIAFFALIEMRLWPHFYLLQLGGLGIGGYSGGFVHRRFGLFRAVCSFAHPIDLGISAALVLTAILILARRTGTGTREVWIRLGLGMALFSSLASMSFTPYMGLAAGLCLYLVSSRVPFTRRLLTLGVAIVIALGFAYTASVASAPLPERPVDAGQFADSRWIRHLIIKESWQVAATAGPFGWGQGGRIGELTNLISLDNSYLLITMERGWVALGLWLALPLCLAATASRALRRLRSRSMVSPTLAGFSASVATMVAMFTVWFGFVYSSVFMVVVALTVNAAQAAAQLGARKGSSASPASAVSDRPSRTHR